VNWLEVSNAAPGWLLDGEAEMLHHYAHGFAVEIGSFAGKSTVCIADAADHLVSIDPHHGNPEMQPGNDCFVPEAWDDADGVLDSLPLLRRTLRKAGVEHKVTCVAAFSTEVAKWWDAPIDFLFIDGDHGPAVAHDYADWSPFLTDGAVLAFHDTAVTHVAKTVQAAEADGWQVAAQVGGCLKVLTR